MQSSLTRGKTSILSIGVLTVSGAGEYTLVISPTLNQRGSLGPLIVYTKATLHMGLTRFVRTKIYFKCISKFRIWRELLCLLKCEVHSVLVMRKQLWTIMAFGRCGFLDFFFQCVCLLQCESEFWRFSRLVAVFSLLLFLFRFAASTFSRVCVCLFISTITFFVLMFVQFSAGGSVEWAFYPVPGCF